MNPIQHGDSDDSTVNLSGNAHLTCGLQQRTRSIFGWSPKNSRGIAVLSAGLTLLLLSNLKHTHTPPELGWKPDEQTYFRHSAKVSLRSYTQDRRASIPPVEALGCIRASTDGPCQRDVCGCEPNGHYHNAVPPADTEATSDEDIQLESEEEIFQHAQYDLATASDDYDYDDGGGGGDDEPSNPVASFCHRHILIVLVFVLILEFAVLPMAGMPFWVQQVIVTALVSAAVLLGFGAEWLLCSWAMLGVFWIGVYLDDIMQWLGLASEEEEPISPLFHPNEAAPSS